MQKDIIHKWFFPHSPEMVWEFLTDSKLLSEWLMENNFLPEVGHHFQFNTKPKVKVGFDGVVYGVVLEINPYKRLSYSWKGGPGKGKITLDTIVTWTLTARDNGTELLLEHKGFKGLTNFISYLFMNKGWNKISTRLAGKLTRYAHETTSN